MSLFEDAVPAGVLEDEMAQAESRANKATLRFVRVGPRKARVVVNLIRGKRIDEALDILRNCQKGVSKKIYKLLDSAVSNVQSSSLDWDLDELYVTRAFVDEGPTMRRFQPRAMGRATRLNKRTSHITLELGQLN